MNNFIFPILNNPLRMASPYLVFMKKELPRLKAQGMEHRAAFKQAAANWKGRDKSVPPPPVPTVTIYYGIVTAKNPTIDIEHVYEDETDAYAFTIGKLLTVLCEKDPGNLQNSTLIDFNQRVQAANRSEYPAFLKELNDIIGTMGGPYRTFHGLVSQQKIAEEDLAIFLRSRQKN
jgi:hypothetical protein